MGWLVGEDDMIKGTPDGEEGMVGWLGIGGGGGETIRIIIHW